MVVSFVEFIIVLIYRWLGESFWSFWFCWIRILLVFVIYGFFLRIFEGYRIVEDFLIR